MIEIVVFNSREHFQRTVSESTFTIGSRSSDKANLIVVDDEFISDFQCLCEVKGYESGTKVKVTNLGQSMAVDEYSRIHHLATSELPLPFTLSAGETHIQFLPSAVNSSLDSTLRQLSNIGTSSPLEIAQQKEINEIAPSSETLSSWFEAFGQIQRSTAGQKAFFELAARMVFNPGGLDGCIILRRIHDGWQVLAQHIPFPVHGIGYRKDLVDQAYQAKLPIFHDSGLALSWIENDLHAAVVCPVLDCDDEVVSMVYGFRANHSDNTRKGIRLLEARFVSLIADSIAAGMIRLDHEADRARQRVLLEQAFSPEVANQLETNPDFLNGQDREVTVLFADLRGFCRISESVGASLTYQLLTDVMNRFTQIVHDHHGVVIDFYGDGMSAFWNAPVDQPDHPILACQAGMAIEREMAALNDVWSIEVGHRLRVGVGIHTGNAQVGNSGSQNRLKYGPQGSTVNIASRLEQATKRLGVNVVVSGDTAERVQQHFVSQRICTAQLSGISSPTDIFHLIDPKLYSQKTIYFLAYQKALCEFESGHLVESLETLTSLADSPQTAQPMLSFLLNEINQRLQQDNKDQTSTDIQTESSSDSKQMVVIF